jgi:hypothetical protein
MSVAASLQSHIAACEDAYQLALEENRILKHTSQPPDEMFLAKKRAVLGRLDQSLGELRAHRSAPNAGAREHRPLIEKAQQLVLKALLLDRENEQLLLKSAVVVKPAASAPPTGQIARLYKKHLAA